MSTVFAAGAQRAETQQAAEALRDEIRKNDAPRALRLYDVVDQLLAIDELLEECGGELTPEIEAQLDALGGALAAKAENICRLVANHDRTTEAYEAEIDRLKRHQQAHIRAAKSLKTYLKAQLERIGEKKLEAGVFKVAIQKNSRPSIVWTLDVSELPAAFQRVTIEPDGAAAYDAWKTGMLPEGFHADLGSHLRIR